MSTIGDRSMEEAEEEANVRDSGDAQAGSSKTPDVNECGPLTEEQLNVAKLLSEVISTVADAVSNPYKWFSLAYHRSFYFFFFLFKRRTETFRMNFYFFPLGITAFIFTITN